MIPFVNLERQYANIKKELLDVITHVIEDRKFILGPEVKQFETDFANLHDVKHCIGCSNGTNAIVLALKALGVKKGDEVITTPHTFIATVAAIVTLGAIPVFADVKEDTLLIDPEEIRKKITEKTRVILPVHLYGQMCEMEAIHNMAKEHGIKVLEDAAQAHLATHKGKFCGHYADAATFSFYPGKNLGAYGDAGAILTNDDEIARFMRAYRNQGRYPDQKYVHDIVGLNERMDTIQGAVLLTKSKYLSEWTEKRRQRAKQYQETLTSNVQVVCVPENSNPAWHLFVIRTSKRDELREELKKHGISSGIHYPVPIHLQPAMRSLGYKEGDFPITEQACKEILSLPICSDITKEEVSQVIKVVNAFMDDL